MDLMPNEVIQIVLSHLDVREVWPLRETTILFKDNIDDAYTAEMFIRRDFPGKKTGGWQEYKQYHRAKRAEQADLQAQNNQALYSAAQVGDGRKCQELLAAGAEVDFMNWSVRNETPLIAACMNSRSQNVSVVKVLLEYGANPNVVGHGQNTPLKQASYNGHCKIVQKLLAAGAKVNYEEHTIQALHYAASRGHPAIVQALLAAGANRYLYDSLGKSALKYAQSTNTYKHRLAARLLLQHIPE